MSDIAQQQSITTQPATTKPRRLLWIIPLPQRKPKTTQIAKAATTIAANNAEPTFYEQCIEWTHRADKVINLALGYLLAIASVLGFMDVLSNGEVLSHVPAAFYIWLGIMGLGVDFQIFLVIGRFPDLARQLNGTARFVFIAFNLAFLAFLCYMSATIGAVFTQHRDVVNSTITGAMQALGINATYFVYERAALATSLLVLMAIDRTMERWRMQVQRDRSATSAQPAQAVTTTAQSQMSAEDIATLIAQTVRSEIEALRKDAQRFAQAAQPSVEVKEIAQGTAQPAIAQRSTMRSDDGETAQNEEVPIAQRDTEIVEAVRNAQSGKSGDVRKKVFAFLDAYHEQHGINVRPTNDVIMAGAPCAKNTASQYRKEYYEQRGAAQKVEE